MKQARAGVALVEAGFEAARRLGSSPQGLVRINLPMVAQAMMEPMLYGFTTAYPDIEPVLVVEDRFIDIVAEGYDAGIRIGETIELDVVAVRLTQPSPLTVIGSPAYFARHGKPQHPEQLADHLCINIRPTGGNLYCWVFQARVKGAKVRSFEIAVKGPLIVNGAMLSTSAATAGVGLTYTVCGSSVDLVLPSRPAAIFTIDSLLFTAAHSKSGQAAFGQTRPTEERLLFNSSAEKLPVRSPSRSANPGSGPFVRFREGGRIARPAGLGAFQTKAIPVEDFVQRFPVQNLTLPRTTASQP